ncbi:MAG: PD-(D/E)XK nuclease family protein [Oxalobacteraceae bacterium]|nr:PD-(D/E)XK nuclease family protein [Oxalobacteraceae bacterium]
MPITRHTIPPGASFWTLTAQRLIDRAAAIGVPLSSCTVLVPSPAHGVLLRQGLLERLGSSFVPPAIRRLEDSLYLYLPDDTSAQPASSVERLLALYASLRQTPWLKKLFAARRNTDLLPLAQTLIGIADELTKALLPLALAQPASVDDRWRAALAQLSTRSTSLLSDEAHMVWQLWQVERDARDPGVVRHAALQRFADQASAPLFWCAADQPDALEVAFLSAWSERQPVEQITLDWRLDALPAVYARSWPELIALDSAHLQTNATSNTTDLSMPITRPAGVSLCPAASMEQEAQAAAQIIVDWITSGVQRIAVVPQDRLVARRLRALLERADIVVADDTGWKLSTTRAASVLHAWIALASSSGEVMRLLDFLQSPFQQHPALSDLAERKAMEAALISAGTGAGWEAIAQTLSELPELQAWVMQLSREATRYRAARSIGDWVSSTQQVMEIAGCADAMAADSAGAQVLALLVQLAAQTEYLQQTFTLAEWRALIDLQLEQTVYSAPRHDLRVMMVPLSASVLRQFDAALVLSVDTEHLPSRSSETLFFAEAVRRELGLETREQRQHEQLRQFAALLISCPQVVLCWQAKREGENVAPSPWIQRLELTLALADQPALPHLQPQRAETHLLHAPVSQPRPSAPTLLPQTLSASGYNTLFICPYQFFASRMLRLSPPDELLELPERRDYGQWVHQILQRYHEEVRAQGTPFAQRHALMTSISDDVFDQIIASNPAALSFRARWAARRDAYVDWANQHEQGGWQFAFGEQWYERMIEWDGGSVKLIGKVDRVDLHASGEAQVLDYKSGRKRSLQNRVNEREDHQLPFYALLIDPPPVRAAYVTVDEDKPATVDATDLPEWRAALHVQLCDQLTAIGTGAALPATGVGKNCNWCAMRGLCRKGSW